jgi:hypothetical protein
LLYALDDLVWGMKITALEESTNFATLDTDASLTSKAFITSAHVGGHDVNLTNTTVPYDLDFALSTLAVSFDEQYENIPDDEIALLVRKFRALHKFYKERRRSPRGCFECRDTTHFITDCPKRKKLNSSKKYDYSNWNDSSNNGDSKAEVPLRRQQQEEVSKDHVPSV